MGVRRHTSDHALVGGGAGRYIFVMSNVWYMEEKSRRDASVMPA